MSENEIATQVVDQRLTHLRLASKRLVLLINFNADLIKDGVTTIANGLSSLPSFACLAPCVRQLFVS